MAADEFRRRVNDDVGAVFDRADQIGGAEGVVDHDRYAAAVGDRGDGVDVGDVAVRVAQRLKEEGAGILLYRGLDLGEVVDIDEGRPDPVLRKGVRQQIEAAAVDRLLCDNVSALRGKRLDRIGYRGGARRKCQGGNSALKGGDPFFQHVLCGIGQPAVDVAGVGKSEAVGGVPAVVEDVGGRLIDRHGSRVGGGVGLFLSYVQLQRFEFIFAHGLFSFTVSLALLYHRPRRL